LTYSNFDCLIVERDGPVGWLINNRPDQLNAMTAHMRDEFAVAWKELDADPEVRVIVHTGAGRAFQTGVDVTEIATDGVGMERYRQSVADFDLHFTSWHQQVWKPVITAVNGICAGGGFHWVADERLSAQRVYELGMISQIVDPPERLREEAQALAEKIAKNSPAAMAATKRALWGALEMGLTDACRAGAAELISMWGHPAQVEGPLAYSERREPVWTEQTPQP
jgi:enoyl-CoA hydratase